ncbi:MAG TPA: serine/threonine-protein kinase [Nocardioidaceae bacterium]|nr:serine/threonine-protein kinase [Nocardioidaceae bacterium]
MTPDLIAGRYRVVRAVGRGGMGTVWLCSDEVLGREVAVKQIGTLPGESAPDAARALREARSSAALNHRNVVSIFDIVDDDSGHAWLVMEYVPSRTLGEITREEGPLDPRRAAFIGAQVADGLAAAHAAGTIHRDVKPGNILVGENDVAKITDFGIARRAGDDQLTRTGLVTGTPSYFSPELARGEDPGPESDVYALGAALYLAVEGRPPYPEQRNAIVMLQKIAAEDPPPPSNAGPLTGPIARMMDRDPRTRWSMADAAGALHRLAEHGDAGDEHTAVLGRTGSFAAGAGAAGAAAASAGAGPAGTTPPDDSWESTPAAHEEDRKRGGMAPWMVAAAVLLLVILGVGFMAMNDETDNAPRAGAAESGSPSPSPDPSPTKSRSPKPEPTPTPTPTRTPSPTPEPTPEEAAGDSADEVEGAVEDYFATVPDDTDAGWEKLSPSMQAQTGRDDYEAWWDSVEEVELHSANAVDGEPQVETDLTYYFTDGSATRETQVLTMEESDGEWLIADDTVVSSEPA